MVSCKSTHARLQCFSRQDAKAFHAKPQKNSRKGAKTQVFRFKKYKHILRDLATLGDHFSANIESENISFERKFGASMQREYRGSLFNF